MAGNIIAGFAPAASVAATGFAPAAAGEGSNPLGAFGVLIDLAAATVPGDVVFSQATEAVTKIAATHLAGVPAPLQVEFGREPTPAPKVDGEQLLAGLVDALAQLEQAMADGKPVDADLADKVSDAIDALAGMLGVPLPAEAQVPVVPPAIDLAATGAAGHIAPAGGNPDASSPPALGGELDTLLALAGKVAPRLDNASSLAPAPMSSGTAAEAVFTAPANPAPLAPAAVPAPALAGLTAEPAPALVAEPAPALVAGPAPALVAGPAPAPAAGPAPAAVATPAVAPPPAPETAALAETPPAIDPASSLGQLVEKITELARTLEPHVPGLAKRLDALVEKLSSGEVSAPVLAELGLDGTASPGEAELDQAIARLLGASSTVKGAPAPQAFAAAQLRLPEIVVPMAKAVAPAPATDTAPPAIEPVVAADIGAPAEPETPMALDSGPVEAEDGIELQPAARTAAADAKVAAVRTEAPAEPAPASQPAAQAAAAASTAVAAGAKAVHAAYQAPVHQVNIPQVAFEVVRQVQAGNTRFQIRLDPPELGRIDVKLDVDQSGNVNARMTVERSETLDLMQRDQRALERALAQAGLDSSKTNLEFSLRQNPFGRENGDDGRPGGSPFGGSEGDTAGLGEDVPEQTQLLYRSSIGASGVNLFV